MTTPTSLPAGQPPVNLETQPFWEATAESRLLLQRCASCGFVIWYPRGLCPDCGADGADWFEASGRGTVYSCTVVRRGQGRWREVAPYVLAFVELDEGPRVMTNIVGCDPDAVAIGQRVEVTFEATGEGAALYRFRPA